MELAKGALSSLNAPRWLRSMALLFVIAVQVPNIIRMWGFFMLNRSVSKALAVAIALVSATLTQSALAASTGDHDAKFQAALDEATKAAGDDAAFDAKIEALLQRFQKLPSGYYVVDGDMRMTEGEIRQMVKDRAKALKGENPWPDTAKAGEMIVNTKGGVVTCYRKIKDRKLTFAVDKSSFAAAPDADAYAKIRKEVAAAAKDWVDACPECQFSFTEVNKPAPVEGDAFFIVRYIGPQGSLIAQAFFPGDDVSLRYLDIAKGYYTSSYDKVGVLRHELGHALGYRHEQNRPETPVQCNFVPEDNDWATIGNVSYTPKSVMHYPCKVDGAFVTGSKTFELQEADKVSHRTLYLKTCKP
jgi:hypothetical protein